MASTHPFLLITTDMKDLLLGKWATGGVGARIALAEHHDVRVHEALVELADSGLELVLFTDSSPPRSGVEVIMTDGDPLEAAATALAAGEVDGVLGGVTRPTADVMRAGFRHVGLAPGAAFASSCFIMILPDGRPVAYADCGIVPDPDARQLATIAFQTTETFELLVGEQARVAMLSFSTQGSAAHPRVEKVRQATTIARAQHPGILIDGEFQFDAAFDPVVAGIKTRGSEVAGNANVFIFPDLDAGNIAYKITERIGGATALGPLIQGLAAPMHDLSRGASVSDIVQVALITAYQVKQGRP